MDQSPVRVQITVTASSSNCGWSATSSAGWITITSGDTGSGNGLVTYSVKANLSADARSGTNTVAGQTFIVTQSANGAPQIGIAPVAPITLPVSLVNLDATVTDDGAPSGTVGFTWAKVSGPGFVSFGTGNAMDTSATFSTNGIYVLRLTASDGALATSNDVTVIVNARPTIASPLTLTNQFATVGGHPVVLPGDPVAFGIGVTDEDGDPLSCHWEFGDGQTSLDCAPAHVFSNCGPHEVIAITSDGIAPVTNTLLVSVACPFMELPKPTSLRMKSSFAPGKLESASFKASIELPARFNTSNTPITMELAGIEMLFTLDTKGQAVSALSSIKLSQKGGGTLWQFSAKLKGDYDATWQNAGLTNATVTAIPITVTVLLLFDTSTPESFYMDKLLLYKATAGKSGSAK